jgi:hypothetical protein
VEQASNSGDVADFKLRLLFPEGRVKLSTFAFW